MIKAYRNRKKENPMARYRTPYIPGAVTAAAADYRRHMRDLSYAKFLAAAEERTARQAKFDAAAAEYEKIRPFRTARARLDQLDAAARPRPLLQGIIAELVA